MAFNGAVFSLILTDLIILDTAQHVMISRRDIPGSAGDPDILAGRDHDCAVLGGSDHGRRCSVCDGFRILPSDPAANSPAPMLTDKRIAESAIFRIGPEIQTSTIG